MKTALIWGASGGIGRALVEKLDAERWTVIAVSRKPDTLSPFTPHTLYADVSSLPSVELAVGKIWQIASEIDLFAYTAGDITSVKMKVMAPATWKRIIDANLTGVYFTTHASLPLLAPNAHLFFLGAIHERLQLPGLTAYAAAKAGLEAFGEALRKELRKQRVTVVRPAAVETGLWDKVPFRMPAHALQPAALAEHIIAAYQDGHKGLLNI